MPSVIPLKDQQTDKNRRFRSLATKVAKSQSVLTNLTDKKLLGDVEKSKLPANIKNEIRKKLNEEGKESQKRIAAAKKYLESLIGGDEWLLDFAKYSPQQVQAIQDVTETLGIKIKKPVVPGSNKQLSTPTAPPNNTPNDALEWTF